MYRHIHYQKNVFSTLLFMRSSQQRGTSSISLCNIQLLIFEVCCVLCEVRNYHQMYRHVHYPKKCIFHTFYLCVPHSKEELLVFSCTTFSYQSSKCAVFSVRYEIKFYICIYNVDLFQSARPCRVSEGYLQPSHRLGLGSNRGQSV